MPARARKTHYEIIILLFIYGVHVWVRMCVYVYVCVHVCAQSSVSWHTCWGQITLKTSLTFTLLEHRGRSGFGIQSSCPVSWLFSFCRSVGITAVRHPWLCTWIEESDSGHQVWAQVLFPPSLLPSTTFTNSQIYLAKTSWCMVTTFFSRLHPYSNEHNRTHASNLLPSVNEQGRCKNWQVLNRNYLCKVVY